ncbi:MAG: efflux RND transporter periplasmic adaptor subunit [Deltaproteobacteria bacterium]|nr:efflux RND transporter periplasmic adaptor subunit [Deltaproteobacteria bacterium]
MTDEPPPRRRHRLRTPAIALSVLAILAVAIAAGAWPRLRQRRHARELAEDAAIPHVRVARPERVAAAQEVVLPGNVQPYASAPIFARVSGYVRRWYADLGARVVKGQLLAQLEVPEIEQQLQQARGTLAASQANLALSEATAARYTGLRATRAVSQQEVDTAVNTHKANQATVAANEASVRQLEQQLAFARVVAPFDGIITARTVDIGDLINAGSSTAQGTALFQIAKPETLRVYVSVPEAFAPAVTPHMPAELALLAHPGKRYAGTLVRTASAIDTTTRTLLVEIHVPNPALELLSGAFAEVHLKLPAPREVFTVPVEALVFRKEGLQVSVASDNRVVIVPITPGRDFGDRIEVVRGLMGDELVILSPPDSIANGQEVRAVRDAKPPAVSGREPP